MSEQLRLLAVHAHADDETITMGATMAHYALRGARVGNVCCTDGELATIVDPELAAREDEVRPRLGELRRQELRDACAILGVNDVYFLGYHDSGMAGETSNHDAGAFWKADLDEVTRHLVALFRDFRPHVVVTYDGNGAYGHPDHIQAHRATLLAFEASHLRKMYPDTGEPWKVSKLYYTAFPRSEARKAVELAAMAGMPSPFGEAPIEELDFVAEDDAVTTGIAAGDAIRLKLAALRAHRSQIGPDFPYLAVPEDVVTQYFDVEHFSLAVSRVPTTIPESDLFSGVSA